MIKTCNKINVKKNIYNYFCPFIQNYYVFYNLDLYNKIVKLYYGGI